MARTQRQATLTSSQNSRAASSSAAASLSPTNGSPAAPPPPSMLCPVQHGKSIVSHRWLGTVASICRRIVQAHAAIVGLLACVHLSVPQASRVVVCTQGAS